MNSAPSCPRCMPGRVEVRGKGNASCATCGGGFIALPQAFAALKKAGVDGGRLQEILGRDGRKIRNCVTCNQMFTSFPLAGEVLHACVPCGAFWVDKGTVDRLTGVSKEPPPPSPMSLRPQPAAEPPKPEPPKPEPPKPEPPKVEPPPASLPPTANTESVLVEDIAPLPTAPPPSAGLIGADDVPPKPARSPASGTAPENKPSAQTIMMIASSLDPPAPKEPSGASPRPQASLDPPMPRGIPLDPAMPAAYALGSGAAKMPSSPKMAAPIPPADAKGETSKSHPVAPRKRETTKDVPKKDAKRDAKKDAPAARIVIEQGGLSTAAKLAIAGLVALVLVLGFALKGGKGEAAPTVIGGGRVVRFTEAVAPTPLALSGGAVTRFSQNKDGNFLDAVYMPVLPEGKGIDVVIHDLYGDKVRVPGGVKVPGGGLHLRGAGDLSRDKAGAQPGRFEAFIMNREGWILAAYGDAGYADSPEAQKFFASFVQQ